LKNIALNIKKIALLPANFVLLTAVLIILTVFFNKQILADYLTIRPFFSYYFFGAIILLIVAIIVLATINWKRLKLVLVQDKYLIVLIIILLAILVGLIMAGPVLVRVDKETSAVLGSLDFELNALSSFSVIFRAKAYFLIMHFLAYIMPITIKSLSVINAFLIVFQMLLVYLILKLLLNNNRLAFLASLLFIFYPNNLLIGRAPDYAFAGQIFGTFSLFTLLLFVKYKDRLLLFWSLAILSLSLFLRIEMIFWLPFYLFLLWRNLDDEQIRKIKNIINVFLLLSLPLMLATIICFFISPTGSISDVSFYNLRLTSGWNLLQQITNYYHFVIDRNLAFNLSYLIFAIPLFWITPLALVFFRDKKIWDYILYFFFFWAIITVFHCNERIDSYEFLSYLIVPLVILAGLVIGHLSKIHKYGWLASAALVLFLIIFGFKLYQPAWFFTDNVTIFWNNEYQLIEKHLGQINNDSVIITNDKISLISSVVNKKNEKIVQALPDITKQIKELKNKYNNVFVIQGSLNASRPSISTFEANQFEKIIKDNFNLEVVYRERLGEDGLNQPGIAPIKNALIFLYKIN